MTATINWVSFMFFVLGSGGGLLFLVIVLRKGIKAYLELIESEEELRFGYHRSHTPAPWAPRVVKPEGTAPARQRAAGEAQP